LMVQVTQSYGLVVQVTQSYGLVVQLKQAMWIGSASYTRTGIDTGSVSYTNKGFGGASYTSTGGIVEVLFFIPFCAFQDTFKNSFRRSPPLQHRSESVSCVLYTVQRIV
jgi:hypothetical protein